MFGDELGFREDPFRLAPDPRFFYGGPDQLTLCRDLEAGIRGRHGLFVLSGEPGSGKTILLRRLMGELEASGATVVYLYNPVASLSELLSECYDGRAGGLDMDALKQHFLSRDRADELVVLLVDEAQGLSDRVLQDLSQVAVLERQGRKLLQIVLAGNVDFPRRLTERPLQALNRAVVHHFRLRRMRDSDVDALIDHRVRTAGGAGKLFSPEAKVQIAAYAEGNPGLVNMLCASALRLASVDHKSSIEADVVSEAARESGLSTVGPYVDEWGETLDDLFQDALAMPEDPGPPAVPPAGADPRRSGKVVQMPRTGGDRRPIAASSGRGAVVAALSPTRRVDEPELHLGHSEEIAVPAEPTQLNSASEDTVVARHDPPVASGVRRWLGRAMAVAVVGLGGGGLALYLERAGIVTWPRAGETFEHRPVTVDLPSLAPETPVPEIPAAKDTAPPAVATGADPIAAAPELPPEPRLAVRDANGREDTSVPLDIEVENMDSAAEPATIKISGLPRGARLSPGKELSEGVWTTPYAQAASISLVLPPNSDADFVVSVAVVGVAVDIPARPLIVRVAALPDRPILEVADVTAEPGASIALPIIARLQDTDGSETLTITIAGVPQGASILGAERGLDELWSVSTDSLGDLRLTIPSDASSSSLKINATARERDGGSASAEAVMHVEVLDTVQTKTETSSAPPVAVDPKISALPDTAAAAPAQPVPSQGPVEIEGDAPDDATLATVPPPSPAAEEDPPVASEPAILGDVPQAQPKPANEATIFDAAPAAGPDPDSTPKPAVEPLAADHSALLARGDELLALGDLAAARLLYELAASKGSVRAALGVAKTYDPLYHREVGLRAAAEPQSALDWYVKAAQKGDEEAQRRGERLDSWLRQQ